MLREAYKIINKLLQSPNDPDLQEQAKLFLSYCSGAEAILVIDKSDVALNTDIDVSEVSDEMFDYFVNALQNSEGMAMGLSIDFQVILDLWNEEHLSNG